MYLGLVLGIQTLLYALSTFLHCQFLCSSLLDRDCTLFYPFQRFLAIFDFPTYTHPIFGCFTGQNVGATKDWFAAETAYFPFWLDDLFAF